MDLKTVPESLALVGVPQAGTEAKMKSILLHEVPIDKQDGHPAIRIAKRISNGLELEPLRVVHTL